ncbi:hypothetical protein FOL47_006858 [Perkinsus chesapeaki]|uniref:Uncharacterized protein n=1 Tax=Perkinsus chesapeaki TaxID=330153 RepID=A0A7J6LP29_PERCH|nr:hypothetical protein FOL47_006858 [Perkinsus chesapeaki]
MPISAPQFFRNRTCGGVEDAGYDMFNPRYCMMFRVAEWMGLVGGGPCPRTQRKRSRPSMSSEQACAFLGKVDDAPECQQPPSTVLQEEEEPKRDNMDTECRLSTPSATSDLDTGSSPLDCDPSPSDQQPTQSQ